jgi:7-cyano-7-deazaguanine synthase
MTSLGSPGKSVILLSGGLDSAVNLAFCAERDEPVLALTMNYGQKAFEREKEAAQRLAHYYDVPHQVIVLDWFKNLGESALQKKESAIPHFKINELDEKSRTESSAKMVWVPNRNGAFINIAASFAEALRANRVVVGFNKEEAETFPDNSQSFLEAANQALSYSTANQVEVFSYTTQMNKREIVKALAELSRPFPLSWVWSCYEGGKESCGECESCRRSERAQAVEEL